MLVINTPLNIDVSVNNKIIVKIRGNRVGENYVSSLIIDKDILLIYVSGETDTYSGGNFITLSIPTIKDLLIEQGFTIERIMNIDTVERDRILINAINGEEIKIEDTEIIS